MSDYKKDFILTIMKFDYDNLPIDKEVNIFKWNIGLFEELSCWIKMENLDKLVYKMFFYRKIDDKIINKSWIYFDYKGTHAKIIEPCEKAFIGFDKFIKNLRKNNE